MAFQRCSLRPAFEPSLVLPDNLSLWLRMVLGGIPEGNQDADVAGHEPTRGRGGGRVYVPAYLHNQHQPTAHYGVHLHLPCMRCQQV